MRKFQVLNEDVMEALSINNTHHPLAISSVHPIVTADAVDVNNKAWGHLYGAIIDGIGANPANFQLIYPFTTWDWPITSIGYVSAAEWDFCATVPQFSATGNYTSSGTTFNDSYESMLNVVTPATSNPQLQVQIDSAHNILQLATNEYDTVYSQSTIAYAKEVGGANSPSFTEWLGTYGGRPWQVKLDSAWKNVQSQQAVYDSLVAQTETMGLKVAKERFGNKDYYSQFQNPSLATFPKVPAYSISTNATAWLTKVRGSGGTKGSISFANAQQEYDYKKTWAGGSASVGNFFWSVNVGGSWERIDEFAYDAELEVSVSFDAWDQITIQADRWYNGAFVTQMQNGPFNWGYSPYGDGNTKAVWGKGGIMSLQKVGMIVCYKPSFSIKVSQSSFKSFTEKWSVSAGLRIGPFEFSGGGGSASSGWKADAASKTFTGTSTAETALIMGVNINQINPRG